MKNSASDSPGQYQATAERAAGLGNRNLPECLSCLWRGPAAPRRNSLQCTSPGVINTGTGPRSASAQSAPWQRTGQSEQGTRFAPVRFLLGVQEPRPGRRTRLGSLGTGSRLFRPEPPSPFAPLGRPPARLPAQPRPPAWQIRDSQAPGVGSSVLLTAGAVYFSSRRLAERVQNTCSQLLGQCRMRSLSQCPEAALGSFSKRRRRAC